MFWAPLCPSSGAQGIWFSALNVLAGVLGSRETDHVHSVEAVIRITASTLLCLLFVYVFNNSHGQSPGTYYTGCNRRNGPDFGRMFLMLYCTDITQNTHVQSRTVTEIIARGKCGLHRSRRTIRRP